MEPTPEQLVEFSDDPSKMAKFNLFSRNNNKDQHSLSEREKPLKHFRNSMENAKLRLDLTADADNFVPAEEDLVHGFQTEGITKEKLNSLADGGVPPEVIEEMSFIGYDSDSNMESTIPKQGYTGGGVAGGKIATWGTGCQGGIKLCYQSPS